MLYICAMIKKYLHIIAGVGMLAVASCSNNSEPKLEGKWQASSIETPSQDSILKVQMKEQLASIDTLKTASAEMYKHYETKDIEVVKTKAREEVNKQPEMMKEQMAQSAKEFSFQLLANGDAITFTKNGADTGTWYFADKGKKLILDPLEKAKAAATQMAPQQVMIFDIVHAGADSMRLRLHEMAGQNLYINLKKETNSKK